MIILKANTSSVVKRLMRCFRCK